MENYSAMKLELLALNWVVTDQFLDYLLGHTFTVFMENNPLSYLQTAKFGPVGLQSWLDLIWKFIIGQGVKM